MKRLYEPLAYQDGPIEQGYWPTTVDLGSAQADCKSLAGEVSCDFAVLGAGYTGLFAALRLAERGADVVVIDSEGPGWGASGPQRWVGKRGWFEGQR